ncbi:paramyosin [Plutella xylostella]|uniref:paramyosin n=1 Tax=Plutella xylostella TaxID=51655 RepID=UPI0020324E58|nr:paramyosin [Plutella xylostella]
MFSFFRKKTAGKPEPVAETPEASRNIPKDDAAAAVAARAPRQHHDVTNEKTNTQKDVVNLLIPQTVYNQKSSSGGIFHNIMAGKKKRNRKNNQLSRAQSCREISPQKETQDVSLQRSRAELDSTYKQCEVTRSADDVSAPTDAKNTSDDAPDHADFVKALVLQKYANKSPIEAKKQHVSLVYVSDEPNLEEKQRAETLLREIAKSIDCTIDKLNAEKELMGATDSKAVDKKNSRNDALYHNEPLYETIDDRDEDGQIRAFKDDLKEELQKLLKKQNEEADNMKGEQHKNDGNDSEVFESPVSIKKSNLKPPRSDTEGCSDDDRSDCGKKRVTFRKRIVFDDGDEQTDNEVDSSFESLTSSEEEESAEEDNEVPDNDERLGGVTVSRNENDNKTVIENINDTDTGQQADIKITIEGSDDDDDKCKRISSDNSDSGFLEISDKNNGSSEDLSSEVKTLVASESESEVSESEITDSDSEEIIEIIEEIVEEDYEEDKPEFKDAVDTQKSLVSQESKFASQVASLTQLADSRVGEAENARLLIAQCRKEIEAKDHEIERLKCSLASAYKESELVRQRSRSLEEELSAARTCSADLAHQLSNKNDEELRQLRSELEDALTRRAELESRVLSLERERDRLEQDKRLQEQRAAEALATAESNTTKWRLAHEAARSQAAARAERMLADCEWKMRELEKRARDAERVKGELEESLEKAKNEKPEPSQAHMAELQQLRGLATEQQRSVQALTMQLQRVETREEALKLEVHRLKELLDRETTVSRDKEERHALAIARLEQQHSKNLETFKAEQTAAAASSRAAMERAHADRTRTALAQLRADAEKDAKNADRKLREVTTRFENLKELLATKTAQFESDIAEAHSKADWELMQLRHMLDKADITYANNMDKANEKFEKEKERLIEEWSAKVEAVEEEAATAQEEAKKLLETTRMKLIAEKNDIINKLKEQHRQEMDDQWERFMSDKENCLARMKAECRQEGEEDRVKREKELLEELAELKAQIQSKDTDYNQLANKADAVGRTLAVTEQELREALAREKDLRERRSEDQGRIKQVERASMDQIEHLTRKCACLRKLFDDMRAKLMERERKAEVEAKAREKELVHLRAEVARLTKLLMEQSAPKLGARTRADGCENAPHIDETSLTKTSTPADALQNPPRRKGGTRTSELTRKRTLPNLPLLPPEARLTAVDIQDGRRRANSVDLPAVQVPGRIKQLEQKGFKLD